MLKALVKNYGHILRSYKTRSTFYIESTLCELICKPKDWVATENKNNIGSKLTIVTVKQSTGESKQSFKIMFRWTQRMELQKIVGRQITTLAGIRRKILIGKAG